MRGWLMLCLLLAGCNLSTGTLTPVPTADVPQIEVINVENGASAYVGTDLTFDIVARDATAGVVRIELRVDGMLLNETETPDSQPQTVFRVLMNWVAEGEGRHFVSLIAYRADGTPSNELRLLLDVVAATSEPSP
jgi:hypothetical protein